MTSVIFTPSIAQNKKYEKQQVSCAIAKMTARCVLYNMGALKTIPSNLNMNWIAWPFAEIRPFKTFQDGGQPSFDITRNSAIRSADPENPTLEPLTRTSDLIFFNSGALPNILHYITNMKYIGSLVAEIWPFAYHGAYETPFWGRGGRRGSAMVPFERAMVVSYKLSIVTIALSLTIRPQFAIECLQRSKQQGVGHFGPKFPVDVWVCRERTPHAN